jgi:hydrogenase maturation protease
MAPALIVGYGNPLRGDDGFGWHAAQRLAAVFREGVVHTIACHQLTPELAEPVSRAALAIFIDAAQQGPPGLLVCRRISPEPALPGALSHYLTPPMLLACAEAFYKSCPRAFLLSVSGAFFGYGEQLSSIVQAALPEAVEKVQVLVAERDCQDTPVTAMSPLRPVNTAARSA